MPKYQKKEKTLLVKDALCSYTNKANKAKLAGCSAGAIIGMCLADLYPDLISGLIFQRPPARRISWQ